MRMIIVFSLYTWSFLLSILLITILKFDIYIDGQTANRKQKIARSVSSGLSFMMLRIERTSFKSRQIEVLSTQHAL